MKVHTPLHLPAIAFAGLLAAAVAWPDAALARGSENASGSPVAGARDLAPLVDRGGGVTVKVTPRELDAKAPAWTFAVAMDTHSQELSQDLVRVATLVDAKGRRHAPLAWEGPGPGGHHRAGVLKFKPLADREVDTVILEIHDVGGVSVRTFRWQLR